MDFIAQSLRGTKKPAVEEGPEAVAAKANAELLDALQNNFNIFFDTVEFDQKVKTVDYIDLLRAISYNTTIRYVTIQKVFLEPLHKEEVRILLEMIGGMPKLETVTIHLPYGFKFKPMDFAKVLYRTKNLKELHLYDLGMTGDEHDMEPLQEALEGLTYLQNISFHRLGLEELDEENHDPLFPDHFINPLASLPALESVVVTASRRLSWDEDSLGGLCESKTLKSVKLKNMKFDASQVGAIAEALQDNTVLTHLQLCDCEIDEDGWRSLATFLPENMTLQELDLSQCDSLDDDGCFVIASCMESNEGLKVLKLYNDHSSQITGQGVTSVFRMLEKNTALETLEISFSGDDGHGFKAVADALQRNNSLKRLYVESFGKKVSTHGVVAIGKALETQNTSLQQIGVVFDGMDSEGVLALAQAMQNSPSLKHFAFNRADYRNRASQEKMVNSRVSFYGY